MVIPSDPAFTSIPDGDVDPDSPVSTNLMTALRDNTDFNNQWMGNKANALPDHRHRGLTTDGTDKVDANDLDNLSAVQGALTLIGTPVSVTSDQNDITFSGLDGETQGQYLIIARFKNPLVSVVSYTLRLNSDDGDGTIITLSQNEWCTLFALVYAKRINESVTFEPAAFFHAVENDSTAGGTKSVYTTIAANVTSIAIHGSVGGNNVATGSRGKIYRFKQS